MTFYQVVLGSAFIFIIFPW